MIIGFWLVTLCIWWSSIFIVALCLKILVWPILWLLIVFVPIVWVVFVVLTFLCISTAILTSMWVVVIWGICGRRITVAHVVSTTLTILLCIGVCWHCFQWLFDWRVVWVILKIRIIFECFEFITDISSLNWASDDSNDSLSCSDFSNRIFSSWWTRLLLNLFGAVGTATKASGWEKYGDAINPSCSVCGLGPRAAKTVVATELFTTGPTKVTTDCAAKWGSLRTGAAA